MAYTIPTPAAPQGGTMPFLGPYAQNQAAAEEAYQNAQANLAAQRGSMLLNYGYKQTANGGIAPDMSNPYGQYQQTLLANEQGSQNAMQSMANRGFQGPGFATQAQDMAQLAAGARSFQMAQGLASQEEANQIAAANAQAALDQATAANQWNSTQYAIAHNLFTPAAVQLSSQEVKQRVAQMQAAWSRAYGGPNGKNSKGMTFQQRLDKLGGSALYNPTQKIRVGGKLFYG